MKIVLHVVIAIFAAGFTVATYVVWAIAYDQVHAEKNPVAPISEMLAEGAAGQLEEVKIDGRRYEYRRRGDPVTRVAYGPKTTHDEAKLIGAAHVVVE